MDTSKKPNKIRDIVRLQQILKKWRKLANSSSSSSSKPTCSKKSIQLILKKTLSFSDRTTTNFDDNTATYPSTVPKGYLAVSVGEEQKRFVIPTEYLGRRAFQSLLREAEDEFGFEQIGVLRIPCEVSVFERVLQGMRLMEDGNNNGRSVHEGYYYCCTSQSHLGFSHHSDHSPLCR